MLAYIEYQYYNEKNELGRIHFYYDNEEISYPTAKSMLAQILNGDIDRPPNTLLLTYAESEFLQREIQKTILSVNNVSTKEIDKLKKEVDAEVEKMKKEKTEDKSK